MDWLVNLIQAVGGFGWLVIAVVIAVIVSISLLDRHPRPADRDKRKGD